jgi:hypothetical protein
MSAEFRQAAMALLLKKGRVVDTNVSWYWGMSTVYDHEHPTKTCVWKAAENSNLKEISFSEFDGTDCESRQSTALILTHVSCSCGQYQDVELATSGSTGDLLAELVGPISRDYK